ncbi:hypothetical protein MPSEU_000540000 [Mayamaea pseudoterrestris]|nr:hypothetical protein MPSEU_000540000 [Mayamaea pseudoterrestris]
MRSVAFTWKNASPLLQRRTTKRCLLLVFLFNALLPFSMSTRQANYQVSHSFRRTSSCSSPESLTKHRISGNEKDNLSFPISVKLSLLVPLRGGAYDSDYRDDGDATAYYSYDQSHQKSRGGNTGGRYQEDWEIPATAAAAARNRQSQPQQPLPVRTSGSTTYDEDYYLDRGLPSPRERQRKGSSMASKYVPSILSRGNKKIGLALLGSGLAVTMLGISLFFNKTLMRLGNLLFIGGVPLVIGPTRTMGYFMQPAKVRATGCLALGIFLVFVGWPVFGIALEVFGLLNLFGNLFPIFWAVAKQTPIVGSLLKQSDAGKRTGGAARRPKFTDDQDDIQRRREEEKRYY